MLGVVASIGVIISLAVGLVSCVRHSAFASLFHPTMGVYAESSDPCTCRRQHKLASEASDPLQGNAQVIQTIRFRSILENG